MHSSNKCFENAKSQCSMIDWCRRVSRLEVDLLQEIQVVPLALGLQLVSSASELLEEAVSSEQSAQPLTYPFADVGACSAFANCFNALQLGQANNSEDFRLTCTMRNRLVDVMLQGARTIAEDPGAPGQWPMVLAHVVPFIVDEFAAMDASTQQSLASGCSTLLDCGLQLINHEPSLATAEAIAVHGAAAAAESAYAAFLVLHTVLALHSEAVMFEFPLEHLGQLCPAAASALAVLMQRCTAQLSEPAASLRLPLPFPQHLLHPGNVLRQARSVPSIHVAAAISGREILGPSTNDVCLSCTQSVLLPSWNHQHSHMLCRCQPLL